MRSMTHLSFTPQTLVFPSMLAWTSPNEIILPVIPFAVCRAPLWLHHTAMYLSRALFMMPACYLCAVYIAGNRFLTHCG